MNTKPKNQFVFLPEGDRKLILDLCTNHTYDQAVEILRRPRAEGGLAMNTSRAALCRFYTSANSEPARALLAQFAAAANIRHEQDSNAFLGAIRATVQAHILEQLQKGRPLADMEKDFRFLKTAEHLYLSDAKFRAEHPKAARASYKDHVQRCAETPDFDFIPLDQNQTSPSAALPLEDITKLERDIADERKRQQETLAILQRAGLEPQTSAAADLNPALLSLLKPRSKPAPTAPVPPSVTTKSPVIPHISRNSTIESNTPGTLAAPKVQTAPPMKPTPHLAPPKPGRNDPCPCGSGRKSKKCCHS